MNKKKISAIILAVSLPVIAYFVSEDIRCFRYLLDVSEVRHKQVDSLKMTAGDRMKDFETVWKVAAEGMPSVYEYTGEFDYDFVSEKEKYQTAVENAESDIEFACVMYSMLNDIPSVHTGFFFPDYKLITEYSCMGSEMVRTDPYIRDTTELWNKEMKHYYRESRAVVFEYTDGKYCYSHENSESKLPEINYTVKSVNGESPDEFILKYLSSSGLGYDEEYGKLYRRSLVFNDSRGEVLTLQLEDANGKITDTEVYYDLCDEYMYVNQPYIHGVYEKPDEVYDIEWLDRDSKIVYLRIDDLDNDKGSELADKIRKYCSDEDVSVILDLRNNGGGTVEYAKDFVYSPLSGKDVTVNETEYILKSSGNRDFFRGVYFFMNKNVFDLNRLSSDEAAGVSEALRGRNVFEYGTETRFTGTNSSSPSLFVLTSDITASSADFLVTALSDGCGAVVIGENTGGEKTGGQFMAELPESRLVYYYCASVCLNSDGSSNSLYGTAPDIRCRQSIEGYRKYNQLVSEGKNPKLPETRLLWDDVLIKAVEMAKNN